MKISKWLVLGMVALGCSVPASGNVSVENNFPDQEGDNVSEVPYAEEQDLSEYTLVLLKHGDSWFVESSDPTLKIQPGDKIITINDLFVSDKNPSSLFNSLNNESRDFSITVERSGKPLDLGELLNVEIGNIIKIGNDEGVTLVPYALCVPVDCGIHAPCEKCNATSGAGLQCCDKCSNTAGCNIHTCGSPPHTYSCCTATDECWYH